MMLEGTTLDEIVKRSMQSGIPAYQSMAKEIMINRALYGDEFTERWMFTQLRLNIMMQKWKKEM